MKPEPGHSTKAIIFDFDGTIADSFEVFLEVMETMLGRRHQLSPEQIQELRGLSTKEVIKKLGIRPWQIPLLLVRGRREVTKRMSRVQVCAGMPDALKLLAANCSLYIVSTNSQKNISSWLEAHGLTPYFSQIYGGIGLTGKAKALKKLLSQRSLQAAECFYVGDETRDIEAAKTAGLRCIAVAWGYNNLVALRAHTPHGLASTPRDLIKFTT